YNLVRLHLNDRRNLPKVAKIEFKRMFANWMKVVFEVPCSLVQCFQLLGEMKPLRYSTRVDNSIHMWRFIFHIEANDS
ncbi:hypothetical protein PFISCL1PPCAC_26801, partial [Pristionchus fissidentatus]